MAINMKTDGTAEPFFLVKRPEDNLERYLEERELFFIGINNKCAAAGRAAQFDDVKLAARIYDVVPLPSGGFKLAKRDTPLKAVDDDPDGHARVVATMSKTLGERSGAARMRGKYNDGAILLDQFANYSVSEAHDFVHAM